MAQPIQPTAIPLIQVGNRIFTDLNNLIILTAYGTASATTGISTFRKNSASAGYQVTSGKTLTIYAIRSDVSTFVAGANVNIGYGDNDVGLATNTTPTNNVIRTQDFFQLQAAGVVTEFSCKITIPSQKYAYMTQGSLSVYHRVTLYCYES